MGELSKAHCLAEWIPRPEGRGQVAAACVHPWGYTHRACPAPAPHSAPCGTAHTGRTLAAYHCAQPAPPKAHLSVRRLAQAPPRAVHSWLTIKILQVTIIVEWCELRGHSREERRGWPCVGHLPPPTQAASSLTSGQPVEWPRAPGAGTGPSQPSVQAQAPTDAPSWAPGEQPGAEAHVGTPAGQGESCPLLCAAGLQGTSRQEAVV